MEFSEPVAVTGAPYLELLIGSAIKDASYYEGSGTAVIRFQYRVANGDNDPDGFSVNGSAALKLNGGAIQSVARPTVNANIALSVRLPGNDGGHKVNGVNSRPSFGAESVAWRGYPRSGFAGGDGRRRRVDLQLEPYFGRAAL